MPLMNVFTYGSLMFSQVWAVVVAGDYRSATGRLSGFARRCVENETYPALIHGTKNDVVAGRVYFDIHPVDLLRLDRFEGVYYRRETVGVALEEGDSVEAEVFLFKDEYKGLLDERDWDVEWFEREGLVRFLEGYKGFGGR